MRRVVTGTTADGRSTVVSDGPPPTTFDTVTELWSYVPGTPIDGDPTAAMKAITDAPRRGGTAWRVVTMPPGRDGALHSTPTVDLDIVLDGRVTLVLEDQEVELSAGDFVVLNGDAHAWRTGPDGGCTMQFVNISKKAAHG